MLLKISECVPNTEFGIHIDNKQIQVWIRIKPVGNSAIKRKGSLVYYKNKFPKPLKYLLGLYDY